MASSSQLSKTINPFVPPPPATPLSDVPPQELQGQKLPGEHEQDDKKVDEDSSDGGDLEADGLESDIPIHGSASVEATPLLSDVLEGLHSVIVDEIGSAIDQKGSIARRRELVPLEDIVPKEEVVLEQVSRDDDMDLGHGTPATELDRSDVKLPQDICDDMIGPVDGDIRDDMIDPIGGDICDDIMDPVGGDIRDDMIDPIWGVDVVGLKPLGNLAGKPPSVQQSITTSLILAGTTATKPNDSSDELPQDACDDMVDPIRSIDVAKLESLKNLAEKAPSVPQLVIDSLVLTGTTNTLPLGFFYAVPPNMQNLIVRPFDEVRLLEWGGVKARENLEALDCQIEEVKQALAKLEVIRNSVPEASLAIVLAGTSSLNGLA
uniref:Uncharacterized protein n=1 Tax=Fagus sylvatica TaxID=28930 RepID=A0A2N9EWY0_FAGSY